MKRLQGASVLMMLESFMGDKNFQLGIQKFLKKYAFANAATPDLWRTLQVSIHFNYKIKFFLMLTLVRKLRLT